jgi:hypothetical protein
LTKIAAKFDHFDVENPIFFVLLTTFFKVLISFLVIYDLYIIDIQQYTIYVKKT